MELIEAYLEQRLPPVNVHIYEDTSKIVFVVGSKRSGKTRTLMEVALRHAMEYPNDEVLILTPNTPSIMTEYYASLKRYNIMISSAYSPEYNLEGHHFSLIVVDDIDKIDHRVADGIMDMLCSSKARSIVSARNIIVTYRMIDSLRERWICNSLNVYLLDKT